MEPDKILEDLLYQSDEISEQLEAEYRDILFDQDMILDDDYDESNDYEYVSSSYNSFAWVYDTFMDNIPYEEWAEYLVSLLKEHGVSDGLVLDMGCGTGNMTELLDDRGYEMIGIDNSEEMLMEAREKMLEGGRDILYLMQDMRAFELYGTVAACVSVCDSMNYITDYEDLVHVFKLVNNYLDPKGVFIFDYKTEFQFETLIGNRTIAENREACSFIWENEYDTVKRLNTYEMTIFIEEEEGLFRRYEEVHTQRAWTSEELKQAAREAGLLFLAEYDAFTRDAKKDDSGRAYMILQESGK